ncbi:MAG: primosomal protein N' [Candidatus Omnitrophica bacterium]|nr:primosomal protein N' [Candidatus Omnitrophota bacterium]
MSENSPGYVQVSLPIPLHDYFTYSLDLKLMAEAKCGMRVLVPFRSKEIVGYITGFSKEAGHGAIKPVAKILDKEPVLDRPLLELAKWMSRYYLCSLGEAVDNMVPSYLKREVKPQGETEATEREEETAKPRLFKLTDEQQAALERIRVPLRDKRFAEFLIHGVTASGKTEIYIRAIQETLSLGRSAICLVPEIALTEQIEHFFHRHFRGNIEIIHSRLTDKERYLAWERIRKGKRNIVLGPRSALFAPLASVGLIVIDEEQEPSYKQTEVPRYHARDVARRRAELSQAVLVMGSATPSLEAMQYANEKKAERLIILTKRVTERPLPEVEIVDMRRQIESAKRHLVFSRPLIDGITQALEKKSHVLLLLNRRGFSRQVSCLTCGFILTCPACQIAMTYHMAERQAVCHYCNKRIEPPVQCPDCGSYHIKYTGVGTEKIESEVARFFPAARIARLDTDVTRQKGSHERIIKAFREGKTDILIGTQMIAKGFDFPHVTLVGVILAETTLALPDFRSGERTLQLLTQFAGRAGRGEKEGKVIIQTFSPHHHSIVCAKEHDYLAFFEREIAKREELGYPPFSHFVNIIMRARDEKKVYRTSLSLKEILESRIAKGMEIIGPAPLPFFKLRGYYRWHIMIKGSDVMSINPVIRESLTALKKTYGVQIAVDVDPIHVL